MHEENEHSVHFCGCDFAKCALSCIFMDTCFLGTLFRFTVTFKCLVYFILLCKQHKQTNAL